MMEQESSSSAERKMERFADAVEDREECESELARLEVRVQENLANWRERRIRLSEYEDTRERLDYVIQAYERAKRECEKIIDASFNT